MSTTSRTRTPAPADLVGSSAVPPAGPRRRRLARGVALAMVGAVALGALTGCALEAPGTLVVGVTATSAEPRPALAAAAADAVEAHALEAHKPGEGAIDVVTQGGGATTVDLTPMLTADRVQQVPDKREQAVAASLDKLGSTIGALQAGGEGLDLLSVLASAAALHDTGSIVVVSSGVQTADPLDLRQLGWSFDPAAVASTLADQGALPDLSSHDVTFVGLGGTAGTQPAPSISSTSRLSALWLAVCDAAGAESCTDGGAGQAAEATTASLPVPVVPVSSDATPCTTPLVLSTAVLFGGDSAVLGSSAASALQGVADELGRCPSGVAANVVGHAADTTAGVLDGQRLSLDRATAVHDELVRLGVPAVAFGDVVGRGDAEPVVDDLPGGVFDEQLAAQNRRVEITFTS